MNKKPCKRHRYKDKYVRNTEKKGFKYAIYRECQKCGLLLPKGFSTHDESE
jgi:hypothetical protein